MCACTCVYKSMCVKSHQMGWRYNQLHNLQGLEKFRVGLLVPNYWEFKVSSTSDQPWPF